MAGVSVGTYAVVSSSWLSVNAGPSVQARVIKALVDVDTRATAASRTPGTPIQCALYLTVGTRRALSPVKHALRLNRVTSYT